MATVTGIRMITAPPFLMKTSSILMMMYSVMLATTAPMIQTPIRRMQIQTSWEMFVITVPMLLMKIRATAIQIR